MEQLEAIVQYRRHDSRRLPDARAFREIVEQVDHFVRQALHYSRVAEKLTFWPGSLDKEIL